MRTARLAALCLLFGMALIPSLQAAAPAAAAPSLPPGEAEFRAAWTAFAEPFYKPASERTLGALQEASEAALLHLEAAVAAAPNNVTYQASLAYVCLTAHKYGKAAEAVNRAIDLERGDPFLYLLRGQAEAALAQLQPEAAAQNIGPSITAFSRAAELDPKNALPLLQAASVAFDVGRPDLALDNLRKALSRPESRLYRLPIPESLGSDAAQSLKLWEWAQYGYWYGLLARCQNVANNCLRLGKEAEQAGKLAEAEERFQQVRHIASFVGMAEPHLFITANAAIDMLEDAYENLARVGEALGSKDTQRWKDEAGIAGLGRQQLYGVLQGYEKDVEDGNITTPAESLQAQAKAVAPILAGIGLPIVDRPPAPTPAK